MSDKYITQTYLKIKHCIIKYAGESDSYVISKISNIKIVGTDLTVGYETAKRLYTKSHKEIMDMKG